MTEKKKKLPEQKAVQYKAGPVDYTYKRESRDTVKGSALTTRSLQRVVKVPESDPSAAWNMFAQRQEQRRKVRSNLPKKRQVVMARRSLAQTVTPALPKTPRPLPSRVPLRSKRAHSWRGILWKFFSIFSVVTLFILLANFLLHSDTFRLEQIQVKGTQNPSLIKNIQNLDVRGQNIFFLNVEALKARVDTFSFVASADISKQLPNVVTVTVVERQPVLLWQTRQGTYSLDREGHVLATARETPGSAKLPLLIDDTQYPLMGRVGGQNEPLVSSDAYIKQGSIPFALEVLRRVPEVTGINVFTLHYDGTMYASTTDPLSGVNGSRGSFIIKSSAGWQAFLGGAHDSNPLANRLQTLREVLNLAQQKRLSISTIDLRYGLRPVFTLQS